MGRIRNKLSSASDRLSFAYRKIWKPKEPVNPDGRVLVHLGPGREDDKRYINVDTRPFSHVHHISSAENPSLFPEGFADLVYACHVLEHMPHESVVDILSGWRRWLKPGGIVRISVPDFDQLCRIYQDFGTCESIIRPLMGGQGYADNRHMGIFNRRYLSELFIAAGLRDVVDWSPETTDEHNFDDWAGRKYVYSGRTYDISLNLEARR